MARTARIKSMEAGKMHYHLMSRACNKQFLFAKNAPKDKLLELCRKAAAFCGIKLLAVTIMSNHFHILCEVVRASEPLGQDEILRRIAILKGEKFAEALSNRWSELACAGFEATLKSELDRWRARMNDISEYMKTVKELFAIWYKGEYGYVGSVWAGVFKSTMIEEGRYLEYCRKYILMNPIRAGIVRQLKDYRWVWTQTPEKSGQFPGCLPAGAFMVRVAQIGSGKLFGGEEFVRRWILGFGEKWRARSVGVHAVKTEGLEGIGYSSHGWRLAAKAKVVG